MPGDIEKWYVLTAFKHEAQAKTELEEEARRRKANGLSPWEIFLPMKQCIEGFGARKRRVTKPVIANYVFVHAILNDLYAFKVKHPFLHLFRPAALQSTDNKCLWVPERQMRSFIIAVQAMSENLQVFRPDEIDLVKGDHVRITSGLFNGVEGTLLVEQGKPGGSVVIQLDNVASIRTWHIDPQYIEVLSFANNSKRLYKNLDTFFELAIESLRATCASPRLLSTRSRLQHLELSSQPTIATLQSCFLTTAWLEKEISKEEFRAQILPLLPLLPASKRESLLPSIPND